MGVVDADFHLRQPGAHKELARHMADKAALYIGPEGEVKPQDCFQPVGATGQKGLECVWQGVIFGFGKGLYRADAGGLNAVGQVRQNGSDRSI